MTTLRRKYLIASLPIVLLASRLTVAQTIDIPYRVACPSCTITRQLLARVGRETDPVDLNPAKLVVDRRGRFYSQVKGGSELIVYNPQGRYLRTVGRAGEGPGEFKQPLWGVMFGANDTLYVVDGNHRVSVFDSSYRFVRSSPMLGAPLFTEMFGTSSFLLSGALHGPARDGFSQHVVDMKGKVLGSFGPHSSTPTGPQQGMVDVSRGAVWLTGNATRGEYRAELWDTTAKRVMDVSVTGSPYVPDLTRTCTHVGGRSVGRGHIALRPGETLAATCDRPSGGYAHLASVDTAGRLWMSITVADARWKPGDPPMTVETVAGNGHAGMARAEDIILEVVDVRSRQVLASARFDNAMTFLGHTGLAYTQEEDANGLPYFNVWRVTFTQR